MNDTPTSNAYQVSGGTLPANGVVFALPSLSYSVCLEFLHSFMVTQWLLHQNSIPSAIIVTAGDCFVAKARNHLATKFLNEFPGVENFFFLDDDIGWPPQKVLEFITRPHDIVCGVYPKKSDIPEWPVVLEMDGDSRRPLGDPKAGLLSARLAPTGFMRIKRRVLEKLIENCPVYEEPAPSGKSERRYQIFDAGYDWHAQEMIEIIEQGLVKPDDGWKGEAERVLSLAKRGDWRGEDADLVTKWRKMGFHVFVDPDIEFTHRGHKMWKGNFIDHYQKWRAAFDGEHKAE